VHALDLEAALGAVDLRVDPADELAVGKMGSV
jgi:hypothetical protein